MPHCPHYGFPPGQVSLAGVSIFSSAAVISRNSCIILRNGLMVRCRRYCHSNVFTEPLPSNGRLRGCALTCTILALRSHVIILSHVGATIDGLWIGEWIYWPLIHMTRKYKQLQRYR
jgi:hypothetical protein